jgi:hypothetical protein
LREECRLNVSENRVLRKISESKTRLPRQWRRLHNKKLHALYSSPNIIRVRKSRRMRWAGHVERTEKRSPYRVWLGRSEGKETTWKTKAWIA